MTTGDASALAGALSARYAAARQLTASLLQAPDSDLTDLLNQVAAQRAAELSHAAGLVASIAGAGQSLSGSLAAALEDQLTALIKEDEQLRAALAARARELPAQIAELRAAHGALGGYQAGTASGQVELPPAEQVNRRG